MPLPFPQNSIIAEYENITPFSIINMKKSKLTVYFSSLQQLKRKISNIFICLYVAYLFFPATWPVNFQSSLKMTKISYSKNI